MAIKPLVGITCFVLFFLSFYVTSFASGQFDINGLITEINKYRELQGKSALLENSLLSMAAQDRAKELVSLGYLVHIKSAKDKPWPSLAKVGYQYKLAGENLAVDLSSPKEVLKNWIKSSKHKANILNSVYTEIGVGAEPGKHNGKVGQYIVVYFGLPTEEESPSSLFIKQTPVTAQIQDEFAQREKIILEIIRLMKLYIAMLT